MGQIYLNWLWILDTSGLKINSIKGVGGSVKMGVSVFRALAYYQRLWIMLALGKDITYFCGQAKMPEVS